MKKNNPKKSNNNTLNTPPPQYDTPTNGAKMPYYIELVALALLSLLIYVQSVRYDYALDDTMVIVKNDFTQRGIDGIGDIFKYESFRGYFKEKKDLLEGDRYRPLSIASFALEQSLFGVPLDTFARKNPTLSTAHEADRTKAENTLKPLRHAVNIALYVLSVFLLWYFLRFLFPTSERLFLNVPFLTAAFFVAHPLHVEVVANIKGRDEILAFLGEILCLIFSFKYLITPQKKYLLGSFLAIFLGILSKESVITFLAIVPLTVWFFADKIRPSQQIASKSTLLALTLPVFLGIVGYLLLRVNAIGYLLDTKTVTNVMNNPFAEMPYADRLATVFYTLLLYLKLHIFPHPLTHDYYPYQIPHLTWGDARAWAGLVTHIGLVAVILRGWQKRTIWAYAAAFYLLTLSIVSNIVVNVGTFMNERFVYHASLGFCLAFAYFIVFILGKKSEKWASILAVVAIFGFSVRSFVRVPAWRSSTTLNQTAIAHSPNSARAQLFYGISIWENEYVPKMKTATLLEKKEMLDKMRPYFDRALQIVPRYSDGLQMWSGMSAEYHKLDNNLDNLLAAFDRCNRGGLYETFVLEYLEYLINTAKTKEDLLKLADFCQKMTIFYKNDSRYAQLPTTYQNFADNATKRLQGF